MQTISIANQKMKAWATTMEKFRHWIMLTIDVCNRFFLGRKREFLWIFQNFQICLLNREQHLIKRGEMGYYDTH